MAHAYLKYGDEVLRYFVRRLHNRQDARELAQEVWTRLLRIDPETISDPLAYIYRAAANVVTEFKMRSQRGRVSFDTAASEDAAEHPAHLSPDGMIEQLSCQSQMERALAGLSPMYRRILLMRTIDDLSYEQIAQELKLSPGTAERYFYKAMAQFRQWLRGEPG